MQTIAAVPEQELHSQAVAILAEAEAPIASATRFRAREWLAQAERLLPQLTAGAIQHTLSLYTPLHTIAYSAPPSPDFIGKWHERTLLLIAKGQKADRLPIMLWMRSRLADNPKAVAPSLRRWYADVIARWVKESCAHLPLSRHPLREARAIAAFLLQENLQAYTPDPARLKSRLSTTL